MQNAETHASRRPGAALDLALLALILTGVVFRFAWVNWSQGTNLHPDEYGLTNTLTQLRAPDTLAGYFNTRLSPISPYQKYDVDGNPTLLGPDNRMRWGQWPITLIRLMGEATGRVGYDEIRLLGRSLSALADSLSLAFLFLAGRKLYGRRTALLGTALSALAVLQIQQSHFMTVDNFGVLFASAAIYAAAYLARSAVFYRRPRRAAPAPAQPDYAVRPAGWLAAAGFGVAWGMAVASRFNLLPLGGILILAALIAAADLRLKSVRDLRRILFLTGLLVLAGTYAAALTFRLTQPMSFRAVRGDTTVFTLHLNPEWVESLKVAQAESNGEAGGPPAQQWANRTPILFPLINMVLWGMGLPLGLAAWAGFVWAAWEVVRGVRWRSHLLPLAWAGGYFLFMATRWVMSVRYFLPIYPALCLLAAWALVTLCSRGTQEGARVPRRRLSLAVAGFVVLGALVWSAAFVRAVYLQDPTRVQAARWIFANVPAPFEIVIAAQDGGHVQPIGAPDGLTISPGVPYTTRFTAAVTGQLVGISAPRLALDASADPGAVLEAAVAPAAEGEPALDEAELSAQPTRSTASGTLWASGAFRGAGVVQGETYRLSIASTGAPVVVKRSVLSNESWDEGLPMPIDGYDPFGQLYRGLTMEVRWYDDEKKLEMFLDNLAQADYIILPSQRGIWSTSRLSLTYPLTIEYYRALFDGRLGFERVAEFTRPLMVGPLFISDVGGKVAWRRPPELPVFNFNPFAAEEAFSVYDHPPVWIFRKRADFDLEQARRVLESVDLSQVVIQSPREATTIPIH